MLIFYPDRDSTVTQDFWALLFFENHLHMGPVFHCKDYFYNVLDSAS